MVRTFSLVLLFVFSLSTLQAYAEPRIYLTSNLKVVADGKEIHCSWWNDKCDFGSIFEDNIDAKPEYTEYQRLSRWTPYYRIGAIGAFFLYSIIKLSADNSFETGTAMAIFIVPWVAGEFNARRAGRHLLKAMNIINGVALDQAGAPPAEHNWFATNHDPRENQVRASIFQVSF